MKHNIVKETERLDRQTQMERLDGQREDKMTEIGRERNEKFVG